MDNLTCIISSSNIPSHPDTYVIDGVISSVRERLPDVEILIMIDGLRREFQCRAEAYEEYKRRMIRQSNESNGLIPVVFNEFLHQALMTRKTLEMVDTKYIFFLEHDTPLLRDIDFDGILKTLEQDEVNLVRLYHYAEIPGEHLHLFGSRQNRGVPLVKTKQWSQRPHLAKTAWYKEIMARYFTEESRTYIEDKVYQIFKLEQEKGLWIYAPEGIMQRSTHACGRGDDPKFGVIY